MTNIIDYVNWRGDIGFDISAFNEIDNLILSELCYIDFSRTVRPDYSQSISLKDASDIILSDDKDVCSMLLMNTALFRTLLEKCANSKRFGNIKLLHFVNKIDINKEMQFSAMVFDLCDGSIYIAFRGTDDTIVGWKEDFNMGIMETVPSQEQALSYLIQAANRFSRSKIILGGHSKGGNLAIYSSSKVPKPISDRIISIYNNDGPGFLGDIMQSDGYMRLIPRINTFVPQSSLVGMLLMHNEDYTVVKSNGTGGITQHDGFSWEVLGTKFVYLKSINKDSKLIDITLRNYILTTDIEERKDFVDAMSSVLTSLNGQTLTEVSGDRMKNIAGMIKAYDNLLPESKKAVSSAIKLILGEGFRNIRNAVSSDDWSGRFPKPFNTIKNRFKT